MSKAYVCRKCGRIHSFDEYNRSRFCRECDSYLMSTTTVSEVDRRRRGARTKKAKERSSRDSWLPIQYESRRGQIEFIEEASKALKKHKVFLGSAPCGIGKSLASLLAVLPQIGTNKLLICFRTRSQLHIFLKELRALRRSPLAVAFFSKQAMCPLRVKEDLSYYEFFDECRRLKENCELSVKPYCRFFWNLCRRRKEAEKLALECARQVLAPEDSVRRMSNQGFCAYEALKLVLHRVDAFLGTYHYLFNPAIREALLNNLGADLSASYLIVDEAHNLPTFSRELLSDKLTLYAVERAIKESEAFEHETVPLVREYLELLDEEIFQPAQKMLRKEEIKRLNPEELNTRFVEKCGVSGSEAAEILRDYGEYVIERRRELGHERIISYNKRIGDFVGNFVKKTEAGFIHTVQKDWRDNIAVEVSSFDGREITDPVLRQAQGSILMSGFLSPPEVYRDMLLYDSEIASLKEFDSPFPPDNRLILAANDVSSKLEKRTGEMMEKWRNYIEEISKANEGNIGVFFTSYGLMHNVLPLIRTDREEIVEQRRSKQRDVMKRLARSTNNALFGVMGGKFSEGIDYPDNLLTCVVSVGLPYSTWNVKQRALIDYLDSQFPAQGRTYAYLVPAILRLVQTCGRVHRSADDKGCIVILDERATRPSIKQTLPRYYQSEMKIVRGPIHCAEQIEEFWQKMRSSQ